MEAKKVTAKVAADGTSYTAAPVMTTNAKTEGSAAAEFDEKAAASADIETESEGAAYIETEASGDANIGTERKAPQEKTFLNLDAVKEAFRAKCAKMGLEAASGDVALLVSQATEMHMKNLMEKLVAVARHRTTDYSKNPRYEPSRDVAGQIKFLAEVEEAQKKRAQDLATEKLKQKKVKGQKMQTQEELSAIEELRKQQTNETVLAAVGPSKKPKLHDEEPSTSRASRGGSTSGTPPSSTMTRPPPPLRITMRDLIAVLEEEPSYRHSLVLQKAYFK